MFAESSLSTVLVADQVASSAVEILSENGFKVHDLQESGISEAHLIDALKEQSANALIVRSATRVSENVLKSGRSYGLRVVARAGVGVDNIDCEAARCNNVLVINAPEGNTLSACEHTCALLMSMSRQVNHSVVHTAAEWSTVKKLTTGSKATFPIVEVAGKTLGIVGLGRIGRAVGERMHAFGMRVIGCDPASTKPGDKNSGANHPAWLDDCVPFDALLSQADYLTVHAPLSSGTKGLIDSRALALCPRGFRLINCARGGIVDEEALLQSLQSGHCAGVALDVFAQEPPDSSNPITTALLSHPSVLVTPHLGASSQEAQIRVAVEVARALVALRGASAVSLSGLEGTVIMNPLGNQCRSMFHEWFSDLGPSTARKLLYLPYIVRLFLEQLLHDVDQDYIGSPDHALSFRITAVVPSSIEENEGYKTFFASLFAHICERTVTEFAFSGDSMHTFDLVSCFLNEMKPVNVNHDEITDAFEVCWSQTTETQHFVCSCLFVHPNSSLDVTKRTFLGQLPAEIPLWLVGMSLHDNTMNDTCLESSCTTSLVGVLKGKRIVRLDEKEPKLIGEIPFCAEAEDNSA